MARPKSTNPKKHRLELRLNDDELSDIDYIAKSLNVSRSEAILDAVQYRSQEIYSTTLLREGTAVNQETKG